jgi:hypothetical protein
MEGSCAKEQCMRNCEKYLSIKRHKERLKTRGFSQKEGEDYDENLF